MEIVIASDAEAVADIAADAFVTTVQRQPDAVLGLATGGTPLPIYRRLIQRCEAGDVTFSSCRAFLLDEYVGIDAEHPASYRRFIRDNFTNHIDIDPSQVSGPQGDATDIPAAAAAYEQAISDAGGIDIQLLGIGTDGHIAFNEPASSLASRTRIKTLTEQTRNDNARFFDGDADAVPSHVLTQGVGTILEARHLVLVATGSGKAAAVASFVEGPVTAMVPASALQWHPHVTVVLDDAASAQLRLIDYYRWVYDNKPEWQKL